MSVIKNTHSKFYMGLHMKNLPIAGFVLCLNGSVIIHSRYGNGVAYPSGLRSRTETAPLRTMLRAYC